MVYDKHHSSWGDGEWHCPYTPEWIAKMKHVVETCKHLTAAHIDAMDLHEALCYRIPPGDFLSEPQDARGLPMSYCRMEAEKYKDYPDCCTAIYDYDSIPELVITNGHDEWTYNTQGKVLQA